MQDVCVKLYHNKKLMFLVMAKMYLLARFCMPFKINYYMIGLFGLNKLVRYTDIGFHFYLNHLIQRMY